MKRADLLSLLEAALAAGQPRYAGQAARRYLADWPNDLGLRELAARASLAEGDRRAALDDLRAVVEADPEAFAAQRRLAALLAEVDVSAAALAFACAQVGDGQGAPAPVVLPAWAKAVRAAYLAERVGDLETARRESWAGLAADTPAPLPSLVHLTTVWHAGQLALALPLAEGFAARWPKVVAFRLCLAECLFAANEAARAMALLHDAAAQDVSGQVARRHWGETHPYRALWEADLAAPLPGPVPAELIQALGLNRLPGTVAAKAAEAAPTPTDPEPVMSSEALAEIQAELAGVAERLRLKTARGGPLQDWYILLSSRTRLAQKFGSAGFSRVDQAMRQLAAAQTVMRGTVVYVDEAASLQPFQLQPVDATKAWDIKLLLHQLAQALRAKGDGLGALLIVGGPDVVPFHHLPNPTEDPDADIPSDNPYATLDENYFVPEWPVGRLPAGAGRDPAPLVQALHHAARQHGQRKGAAQRGWLAQFWQRLLALTRRPAAPAAATSFGYSANIWRQASAAVYDVIGDRGGLVTCPPVDATRLPPEGLAPAHLSYFNLHGIEDGPEWYGQRSHDDPANLPEYPVALRPRDVVNGGRAPHVVFSEACYGANVFGKTVEDALCLRFLAAGTRVLVGSTKIAYGSVGEPLIGADLLGQCFWQNVNAGLPAGEALRLAKIQMAQDMHTRQGFLDGEDQKTLISFVLYGDPLALVADQSDSAARAAKRRALKFKALRPVTVPATPIESALTPETVAQIKSLVAQYLPEMRDAELRAARTRALPANAKRAGTRATTVTLAKTVRTKTSVHPHFARITLDDSGRIVKLSVSR